MKANTKTMIAHICAFSIGASACAAANVILYLAGGGDFAPGKQLQGTVFMIVTLSPLTGFMTNCALGVFLVDNKFKDD